MTGRATLLVELLTEELPPKSLRALSEAFAERSLDALGKLALADPKSALAVYATPRRLAFAIADVADKAPGREMEVSGPSAKAPAAALEGFARKHGLKPEQLERRDTPKGPVVLARVQVKGALLDEMLAPLLEEALKGLPIPKLMRWGASDAQFVRPVHGLIVLHGSRVVPGKVLGVSAGRTTSGHRFLGERAIELKSAEEYASRLEHDGKVIAGFAARRAEIDRQLKEAAIRERGSLGGYADLLDEVTALVEYPQVYAGGFDRAFLEVPPECLILTMRQNQKYFPLFDNAGKLLPRFLIVSNMRTSNPSHIVAGNERVVRPRLEDARFFYNQDRKVRLESRVPPLAKVVYHAKLGSMLDRVERLRALAGRIAERLQAERAAADRAAYLCKADRLTGMVGEFPELQGVMGRYYALHDGESPVVADAIAEHYLPGYAGGRLPVHPVGAALALADKLEALAGFFSIGQTPTGERDPFGLRRAALGVIRILVERKLGLALDELLAAALAPFAATKPTVSAELESFVYERARGYFREHGYSANEVEAVLCLAPARLDLIPRQLEAVRVFAALPEAESLAAANKRIGNILKQADAVPAGFDVALMVLPEEKSLASTFGRLEPDVERAFRALDYTAALKALATLKTPVDAFFDKVMVMDKDPRVRANRIGFLGKLHGTMNRIADLSKLAT
ncbi:MAG: glycine--tRNA ligase subunit beta [Betaproteobacteria bacterium]|nr:MAG: glycine--tRNA ligase subunit beta [Betaproteobacteria bacterium]